MSFEKHKVWHWVNYKKKQDQNFWHEGSILVCVNALFKKVDIILQNAFFGIF